MDLWPVFIDFWQQECCGQPFALGDSVEWTVRLVDGQAEGWPGELLVDVCAVLHEHPDPGPQMSGTIAVAGGVQAWWEGAEAPGSTIELRGLQVEDHHGHGFVATADTVRRIRVIARQYTRRADKVLMPGWSGWSAVDVERSPRWSTSPLSSKDDAGQTGLLVDLEPAQANPFALKVRWC